MHGQPPSITAIALLTAVRSRSSETLPAPGPRCIQTCLIPSSAHSRIVSSAISGLVPITTASTPPGIGAEVVVGAVALDLVGVRVDREHLVAALAQALVDDVAPVASGLVRRR